jgi:hypothetical protein
MAARSSFMDQVVWKAYNEPPFFDALMEHKNSIPELRSVLQTHGFRAPTLRNLTMLKRSLNHRFVHASPEELMTALHQYTRPHAMKKDSWVQW